jgi:SAM-dependent methyltransferase
MKLEDMNNDMKTYLAWVKSYFNWAATQWEWGVNADKVVGYIQEHNCWPDYYKYLFKGIETDDLVALDFGCGLGRSIVQYRNDFKRIDGVDISSNNLLNARIYCERSESGCNPNLYETDGVNLPVDNESYDVVYSVICLQHVPVYDIRFGIFEEAYRVLKPNGYLCFQMGYGRKLTHQSVGYYDNYYLGGTNGGCDVTITNVNDLKDDLIDKLNFRNFKSYIRPTGPNDTHENWVWVQVQK